MLCCLGHLKSRRSSLKGLNHLLLLRYLPLSRFNSTYFITTPIFYVNSSPHIGHLYTALLADAAQRFQRLLGTKDILFMTGTDEHGSKIQQAASRAMTPPQDYCDQISSQYEALFKQFGISYTHFIRTTSDEHVNAVHHFWRELEGRGHLYRGQYRGWYCIADEAFLTESQLAEATRPDGSRVMVSAESGREVEWTEEDNFMFRLSAFRDDLLYWLKDDSVVQPAKFLAQLRAWVHDGTALQDVSVSRPSRRVSWAAPVPDVPDHTVYVWLDALVSYLTAAGYPCPLALPCWPPRCQTLGKDILKFHGVYWPAFLLGAGLQPPARLSVHSHWTVEGEKMSKSQGNVVAPADAAATFTAQGLRYFLLREGTPHSDANYSAEKVLRMLNAELADTMGNLLNRCCGKAVNTGQRFPPFIEEHFERFCRPEADCLMEQLRALPDEVADQYSSFNYYRGIDAIVAALREANRFFEVNEPWKLRKAPETQDHLDCVLHVTMETLRVCGIALQPVVPEIAERLLDKLNVPRGERLWNDLRKPPVNQSTVLNSDNVILYKKVLANK